MGVAVGACCAGLGLLATEVVAKPRLGFEAGLVFFLAILRRSEVEKVGELG